MSNNRSNPEALALFEELLDKAISEGILENAAEVQKYQDAIDTTKATFLDYSRFVIKYGL